METAVLHRLLANERPRRLLDPRSQELTHKRGADEICQGRIARIYASARRRSGKGLECPEGWSLFPVRIPYPVNCLICFVCPVNFAEVRQDLVLTKG